MTWQNEQSGCMLCDMEKKTKWYFENEHVVVAEKLGGGPFIVWKDHTDELADQERGYVEGIVDVLFGDAVVDLRVRMSLVPDHWHCHILVDEDTDLSDE